jgi:outer membrane protein
MCKIKSLLPVLTAFLFFALGTIPAAAQYGKFGYVDSDKIFKEYKEIIKAQEEFETEYRAWDEEAKDMQEELEELILEFEKQKLILSEDKKKEREAAIEAKRQALDAYTREIFGPQGAAERKNAALMQPILDKINEAINQIATEGNYDFIFNSAALAYAKPEYDITDKILELLAEE